MRLASSLHIDSVFVQHLCHDFTESTLPPRYAPMREFVTAQTLIADERAHIDAAFRAAREAADRCRVDLRLPRIEPRAHPPGTPGPARCQWPWHGPYVAYDGHVMPCCMIATPDRGQLGRVSDSAPIDQIWHGAAYESFRAALASDTSPAVCEGCAIYRGTF